MYIFRLKSVLAVSICLSQNKLFANAAPTEALTVSQNEVSGYTNSKLSNTVSPVYTRTRLDFGKIPLSQGISGPELYEKTFLLQHANFIGNQAWLLDYSNEHESWIWKEKPDSLKLAENNMQARNLVNRQLPISFIVGGTNDPNNTCPEANIFVAPQACSNVGGIQGHAHIVVEQLMALDQPSYVSFYATNGCNNYIITTTVPVCATYSTQTPIQAVRPSFGS